MTNEMMSVFQRYHQTILIHLIASTNGLSEREATEQYAAGLQQFVTEGNHSQEVKDWVTEWNLELIRRGKI